MNQLTRAKQRLTKKLEEAKSTAEDDNRKWFKLQGDTRSLQEELTKTKEHLEEEERLHGELHRCIMSARHGELYGELHGCMVSSMVSSMVSFMVAL